MRDRERGKEGSFRGDGKRANALVEIKQIHSFVVTKGMDIFSYGIGIATFWEQIKDKMIFKKPLITDGTFHLYPFLFKNRTAKGPAAKVGPSA